MSWLSTAEGADLDATLGLAAQRDACVLVCWTVGWCPPCNELKLMIFDDPQFARFESSLQLLRIDGDGPGAQTVGERLGVRNYPSTLLLDATGRERLRMPGGLRPAEFCRGLDLALAHDDPIDAIVARLESGQALRDADHELLALHWWGVDDRLARGAQRLPMLRRAHAACPPHLADARLRLLVQVVIAAARSAPDTVLDGAEALSAELVEALASPAARYSNVYFLIVDLSVLRVLGERGRQAVEAAIMKTVAALVDAGTLAMTERLITLSAWLSLCQARAEVPPDLVLRIRQACAEADRESVTTEARQTAINMAGHLLKSAGFVDEAVAMFEHEAARSPHAGYFLPYIAQTRLEQGLPDAAIGIWRQSWQLSPRGTARWVRGANYVAQLAAVKPARREHLEREALEVLKEIGAGPDALAGINRSAVATVLKALATPPAAAQG